MIILKLTLTSSEVIHMTRVFQEIEAARASGQPLPARPPAILAPVSTPTLVSAPEQKIIRSRDSKGRWTKRGAKVPA
jgi:hypothetical protein